MRDITNRERKIIKAALLLSVIISAALGLKGVFIDLYDPGSPVARQYSDWVNRIFIITAIISLPLLAEKFKKFNRWLDNYSSLEDVGERDAFLWKAARPIVIQIVVIGILIVVVSIAIAYYWEIPPDVYFNYQNYYSGNIRTFNSPAFVNLTKDINNSLVNNITVNSTTP